MLLYSFHFVNSTELKTLKIIDEVIKIWPKNVFVSPESMSIFTSTVELLQVINIKRKSIVKPDPIVTEEHR